MAVLTISLHHTLISDDRTNSGVMTEKLWIRVVGEIWRLPPPSSLSMSWWRKVVHFCSRSLNLLLLNSLVSLIESMYVVMVLTE